MKLLLFLVLALFGFSCAEEISKVNITPRIVNGQRASVGQFPWHALVAVQYHNDNTNKFVYCSGTILNEYWIITNADCVKNARTVYADLGSINAYSPLQRVWPEYYVLHPKFNADNFQNNIALLRFPSNKPIPIPNKPSPEFRPIRLPRLSQRNELFVNVEAYFTGYGYNSINANNISDTLLFSETRVISTQVCQGYFGNDQNIVNSDVVCALPVNGRQGACAGDGSAPLFINEFGEWTLIGTLSFLHSQNSCGRQPTPSGFTRITSHYDWIARTTGYNFRP